MKNKKYHKGLVEINAPIGQMSVLQNNPQAS